MSQYELIRFRPPHLEAELLSQDAAVQRFDEHVLLHAEVQSLHRAARAQQRLMGGRLLQLGEPARSGRQEEHGNRDECEAGSGPKLLRMFENKTTLPGGAAEHRAVL